MPLHQWLCLPRAQHQPLPNPKPLPASTPLRQTFPQTWLLTQLTSPKKLPLPLQWLKRLLLKPLSRLKSLKSPKTQPSLQKLLTLQKTPLKLLPMLQQSQPMSLLMQRKKWLKKQPKKLKLLPNKLLNSI